MKQAALPGHLQHINLPKNKTKFHFASLSRIENKSILTNLSHIQKVLEDQDREAMRKGNTYYLVVLLDNTHHKSWLLSLIQKRNSKLITFQKTKSINL